MEEHWCLGVCDISQGTPPKWKFNTIVYTLEIAIFVRSVHTNIYFFPIRLVVYHNYIFEIYHT